MLYIRGFAPIPTECCSLETKNEARKFKPTHDALNQRHHNVCGAKKQKPYSDGLPFKRRRQPECVQTVSLLWLLSVTTESDRKKLGKQFSDIRIVLCASFKIHILVFKDTPNVFI